MQHGGKQAREDADAPVSDRVFAQLSELPFSFGRRVRLTLRLLCRSDSNHAILKLAGFYIEYSFYVSDVISYALK